MMQIFFGDGRGPVCRPCYLRQKNKEDRALENKQARPSSSSDGGSGQLSFATFARLLCRSHTLLIQGDSYQLRLKRKAGLLGRSVPQATTGC